LATCNKNVSIKAPSNAVNKFHMFHYLVKFIVPNKIPTLSPHVENEICLKSSLREEKTSQARSKQQARERLLLHFPSDLSF